MSKLHKRHLEKKLHPWSGYIAVMFEQKNIYIHNTRIGAPNILYNNIAHPKHELEQIGGALHEGKSTGHAFHFFGNISMLLSLCRKYDCAV
jgi:hypothetical protein